MTLATIAQLKPLTSGGRYDDSILTAIVEQAERELEGYLAEAGLSLPGSSSVLTGAELNLAHVGYLNRRRDDDSKQFPQGGASSDSIDKQIAALQAKAEQAIKGYIGSVETTTTTHHYVVKVNA